MHSRFLTPSGQGRKVGGIISIAPSKPRIEPMAKNQWPLAVLAVARFRKEGDLGIGDTVARLIGSSRSERFKKWFALKFHRDCGCTDRQRWLNARFPYL